MLHLTPEAAGLHSDRGVIRQRPFVRLKVPPFNPHMALFFGLVSFFSAKKSHSAINERGKV
ncbi:hypothetical protein [Novosphingobium sp. KACC 22771]|uniref:hypothetical protein n=1 Tax=Novosphingobium sp. KACC 22771 TaxID=3025670 RepID=UPI002365A18D|nr:hypothetical protein [Novosphingobium sp. KACC 22771]WDF72586.1 hypothetical protein PQ467_00650 [Novosphingobium sp. KACC 22771]